MKKIIEYEYIVKSVDGWNITNYPEFIGVSKVFTNISSSKAEKIAKKDFNNMLKAGINWSQFSKNNIKNNIVFEF